MRIVFYTENYTVGGCDRFLADLVAKLDPGVFEIMLAGNRNAAFDEWLASRIPARLPREEVRVWTGPGSGVVRRVRPLLSRDSGDEGRPGIARAQDSAAGLGSATVRYAQVAPNYVRLRRLFSRLRPDLVHINNGGYPGGETCRLAALAARAAGVRGVVHFVHSTAMEPVFPTAVERAFDRRTDRATDVWLTAADRAAKALHERRDIRTAPIQTVHYGVERRDGEEQLQPPRPAGGRAVATVIASFDPGKGHAVLIDALGRLKAGGFRLTTLLVGQGPERATVERRVAEAGLLDDIQFLGWRDDVPSILSSSDLLVLPSVRYECLPYSILEAM